MNIILYTSSLTNRVRYILHYAFDQYLGISLELTSNKLVYINSRLPKINYSNERILPEEFFIPCHPLLAEKSIKPQSLKLEQWDELPSFFSTTVPDTDIPFDIFASSFYLISRYEEYLPFEKDQHHRFSASESLAYRANFLHQPLVNCWFKKLGGLLQKRYPSVKLNLPVFNYLPTYDIDLAWAYKNKGIIRSLGGYINDLSHAQISKMLQRLKVQIGNTKDPFDTFDYLELLHKKYKLRPIFFFLLGNYGTYDKNIAHDKNALIQLIQSIHQQNKIGIHPSYSSNSNLVLVDEEKTRLENITNSAVISSRQHFLKLHFPTTYQQLIAINIEADYSMGYAEDIGFRASVATPFFWYDLENETPTKLVIHPFQVMDVTLQKYCKLTPSKVLSYISPVLDSTREVGGTFCTLWHNSSLSGIEDWKGWELVYEQVIERILRIGTE